MALDRDPYQVLGLARGASLDDVKRAYRGLAKANHPDAAGESALPRFLAIQAAYEQIAGGAPTGPGGRSSSRPSAADPDRAGATYRAYGARGRRARPGTTPGGSAGGGWATGRPSGTAGAGKADRGPSSGWGSDGAGGRAAGAGAGRSGDPAGPAGRASSDAGAAGRAGGAGEPGGAGSGPAGAAAPGASGRGPGAGQARRAGPGADPSPSAGARAGSASAENGPGPSSGANGAGSAGPSTPSGTAADGAWRRSGASAGASHSTEGGDPGSTTGPDDPAAATGAGPAAARRRRNKATLGSTSYDGADATPFEPDWGGASWYGTTSGTYWTLNPKEYADPRKHGPEYQARARRWSRGRTANDPDAGGQGPEAGPTPGQDADDAGTTEGAEAASGSSPRSGPIHTTTSWWESTSGPADGDLGAKTRASEPAGWPGTGPAPAWRPAATHATSPLPNSDPPDIGRALSELGRALLDDRSGGVRGRIARAVVGWLPIAFGLGWLAGELTGCGRFAATCDGAADPFVIIAQVLLLGLLLAVPLLASVTTMATITLLAVASFVALVLSATGAAADDGSRRVALGGVLLLSWLGGLLIAAVRRTMAPAASSRPAPPVS